MLFQFCPHSKSKETFMDKQTIVSAGYSSKALVLIMDWNFWNIIEIDANQDE